MSIAAGELERGWRLVESRGAPAPETVAADPLLETAGSPLVGIDPTGARHLLIPIEADAEVSAVSSAAVTLTKRMLVFDSIDQMYVDVACTRPDLFDEFAVLASEVVSALRDNSTNPAAVAARVLHDWQELLRSLSLPRLDRGGIIGLFAELRVLETLMRRDPRRRTDCWTGPSRGRYDFQRGETVLEVKGSTARRGRPVVIHGLDQLEDPPNGLLHLCWLRLEVGIERGESLGHMVESLLDLVSDPVDLEQKLRNTGYDFSTPEAYEKPLLTELERRVYRVGQDFPRLTRADLKGGDLPRGVLAVDYQIDLSGDQPRPLEPSQTDALLDALVGE
jgi:hypothetical protein